ncbi:MAG TPA: helix-turn-helix transcriptional regulator [Phytomonospora sp.]
MKTATKGYVDWDDVREDQIERAGGEAAVAETVRRHLAEMAADRLAEKRKSLGMTQADVAERMGITKGRVSQIERGEVSTVDVLARYSQALGGELRVIVRFADEEQLFLGSSSLLSEAALDPEV